MPIKKGLSPLIATIMLIAFTLIVAGILAGWATRFAEIQRREIEICLDARVLIQAGIYNATAQTLRLIVYNYGKVPLSLKTMFTYRNLTLHPYVTMVWPTPFNISAGAIESFLYTNVTSDLDEVTVQDRRCLGTQDLLRWTDIRGLGMPL